MTLMKPHEIFPKRNSHHAMYEQLRKIVLPPDEVQRRADAILNQDRVTPGGRVGYIHHPFCEKLCRFCSFFRVKKDEAVLACFLDALNESIRRFGDYPYVKAAPFDTFYFGGGTPTTISVKQMNRLMQSIRESFQFTDDAEFTSESTFANLTEEMLTALKEGGVNRMSLGVQTFSPPLRKFIGRECHPTEVIQKISVVRRYMDIVNLDLIYNFPTQTFAEWEVDLKTAINTGVESISVHPLVPVKDSALSRMIDQGVVESMGDEKKQYEFYTMALDILRAQGYRQINFCFFTKSEKERIRYFRHKFQEGDCFSFGPGAVGNLGELIYFNLPSVDIYIAMVQDRQFPGIAAGIFNERLKVVWAISEELLFGTVVNKKRLNEHYGVDINRLYGDVLRQLVENNLIEDSDDSFTLTPLGLFWVHNIGELFQTKTGQESS
jgi:putative oxygen-independent coproporphyrinogen III oxidase